MLEAGEDLSVRQRALLRLAATHGSNQAAGWWTWSTMQRGRRPSSSLRARPAVPGCSRRDQQIQSSDLHYQAVGRVLLGLEPHSDYV